MYDLGTIWSIEKSFPNYVLLQGIDHEYIALVLLFVVDCRF